MKLPSLNYLISNAKDSLLRFPLTIFSALITVIFGIYLIENEKIITNIFPYINIILCMGIGIPLFFCVTIISNKKQLNKNSSIFINLLATLILVAIFFTLPNKDSTKIKSMPYIKYTIYNITCHLLVSFIPFAFSKQLNAFWQYNKILFIRILTSLIYSGFIYVGLIIALTSLNLLFDIKIHEKLYMEFWIATMCFFNTWFFVSGIPKNFEELESIEDFPKGLKIFAQYVLLPLLGLYLLILYAYGTKILILWDWPKGIVSYLIIFVSVLGILAFLLLHPYGNQKENSWIKKVSRGYYFILFPLLIILFIAIFMRLNDYGITINRYIILILGIWLTLVCLYTAIGKTNIKFIPTSLAFLAILVSFGPWGMFSISEKSQVIRLKNILEQSKILVENKIQNETIWIKDSLPKLNSNSELKNEKRLTDSLHNEVKSILDYLDDHHGFSLLNKWYKQDVDSLVTILTNKNKDSYKYKEAEIYMKTLGLNYEHLDKVNNKSKINYTSSYNSIIKTVTGYDYLINFSKYNYNNDDKNICTFNIDSVDYNLIYTHTPIVKLFIENKNEKIEFKFKDLLNNLKQEFGNRPESVIPVSKMQVVSSNNKFEIKIQFHSIEMEAETKEIRFNNFIGEIFIKKKN